MKKFLLSLLIMSFVFSGWAQTNIRVFDKNQVKSTNDWLLYKVNKSTQLYKDEDGHLVFSNGLVSRTFSINPNGATIGLEHLQTGETFLRSVRPEAEVQIDGITFEVGGLTGQPIHNYLLPEWIESMKSNPASFKLINYTIENTKERFAWKKRKEWMPKDMPWPAPGKELIFTYKLDDDALKILSERSVSDESRKVLFSDSFEALHKNWNRFESKADARNSFINEGKAGEIMALANTAVFADQPVIPGTKVFLAKINPGTDKSSSWGPGLGLVFLDKVIKINLRPGNNEIGFYDGEQEKRISDLESGKPVWLRIELQNNKLLASYSYNKTEWKNAGEITFREQPGRVRVGKMDWSGKSSDHSNLGERGRNKIEEFYMLGEIPESVKSAGLKKYKYLKNITVNIHYELYDGLPVFSKWLTVENITGKTVNINSFKSEILSATEPESTNDNLEHWMLPNITLETDYNFGGTSSENLLRSSIDWKQDPLYKTQVNYQRLMPYLLEVSPKYGPEQEIQPGKSFSSYRVWELLHDSMVIKFLLTVQLEHKNLCLLENRRK